MASTASSPHVLFKALQIPTRQAQLATYECWESAEIIHTRFQNVLKHSMMNIICTGKDTEALHDE